MFKFFKKKLKNWTEKIKEESEKSKEVEEPKESKESEKTKETEKGEEKEKIIPIPQKFNVGLQSYEPDLEKIKDIEENLKKKEIAKPGTKSFFKKVTSKIQRIFIRHDYSSARNVICLTCTVQIKTF